MHVAISHLTFRCMALPQIHLKTAGLNVGYWIDHAPLLASYLSKAIKTQSLMAKPESRCIFHVSGTDQ